MTDEKVNVTDVVRDLLKDMVSMLVTYEMELTAYYIVIKGAQDKLIQAGIPWDLTSNVRKILASPALHAEAEAEYAPFFGLLQKATPQNLQVALASIKRTIQKHRDSIPDDLV
jgi:hypothetical protein